jgi:hypothetical protein
MILVAAPARAQHASPAVASSARPDASETVLPAIATVTSPAPPSSPAPAPTLDEYFTRAEAIGWQRHHRAPFRGVVPRGTRVETLPTPNLWVGSALAIITLPGTGIAALALHDGLVAIPMGGPFYGAYLEFSANPACGGLFAGLCRLGPALAGVVLVLDGIAQVASGVLITAGLMRRRPWLVPDGTAQLPSSRMRWAVIPGTSGGLGGVTAIAIW